MRHRAGYGVRLARALSMTNANISDLWLLLVVGHLCTIDAESEVVPDAT